MLKCNCHWSLGSLPTLVQLKRSFPKHRGGGGSQGAVREAVPSPCFKLRASYLMEHTSPGIRVGGLIFLFLHLMPFLNLLEWRRGGEGQDSWGRPKYHNLYPTPEIRSLCRNFKITARLHRNLMLYISI